MNGRPQTPSDGEDRIARPVVYDASRPEEAESIAALLADPALRVLDRRDFQRADVDRLLASDLPDEVVAHPGCWVHYPWHRTVVGTLHPEVMRTLRLDRNRNKITAAEQRRLGTLRIGVVGLSVGHAIAHTLALEGLCGELRLADFDTLEVSNLNRIPATLLDLDVNKAVIVARRIAEVDPFLDVSVFDEGVHTGNLDAYLDGLDVLVEECDSLDLKVLLREEARRRGIPVVMETSDRGLLDVERYDLEPDRPLFHGLLGDVDAADLTGLATRDKVPHVLGILGASELSPRFAASLVEVDRSITTWPQLGGDVALGGASVAAAVRRLGLGRPLPSGRVRIDLEHHLDGLTDPTEPPVAPSPDPSSSPAEELVPHPGPGRAHPAADAVLEAVRRAPSGGNVQPWRVESDPTGLRLYLRPEATTMMDVAFRGSQVALGAALFNARAAASAQGALGPVELFPDPADPYLVATLRFGGESDERLTRAHPGVLGRGTNRGLGRREPLPADVRDTLCDAAAREGGQLRLVGPGAELVAAGEALAAADRVRYLTARLHQEMFSELVWPGPEPVDVGIEVTSLGLDAADVAKLDVARRPDAMALLAEWDAGIALMEDTRDRVASSSALAVVTVPTAEPADMVRGGAAVEAVWIGAEAAGLGVQPVSPVFLYAADREDLGQLSPRFAGELARRRAEFRTAVGLTDEAVALVLRLSHAAPAAARSRRLPLREIHRST